MTNNAWGGLAHAAFHIPTTLTSFLLTSCPRRYNQFRRLLQLKPLLSIDDLTADPEARAALKSVYGDDIELVDLLPGVLAETHRPDW
jgi:hypothetical protein